MAKKVTIAAPSGVSLHARGGSGGWDVSWNKVRGATSYTVFVPVTGQRVTTTRTSTSVKDLKDDERGIRTVYTVEVRANFPGGSASAVKVTPCAPAYILSARGSGQGLGAGPQGLALTNTVRKNLGGQSITQLPSLYVYYDAIELTYDFGLSATLYGHSKAGGVRAAVAGLNDIRKNCPGSKVILFGFSQGADVIGDTIAMSSVSAAMTQVPKVVLLSDPRRNDKERAAVQFPKVLSSGGLLEDRPLFPNGIWQKVQSWCDGGDNVCHPSKSNGKRSHYQTEPGQYLLDCASWWVEGSLQSVKPYKWNKRKLAAKCNG